MSKKTVAMHIAMPILLAILSFFISIMFVFRIPNPSGIGYTPITYMFAFKLSLFVLGISAIISCILFVGKKNKYNQSSR